jgi:Lrp/AsnC family transcriptional regulator, regulator for asnA, asnC and gidA
MKGKKQREGARRAKPPSVEVAAELEPLDLPSDPLNREIISRLQEDGRASFVEIARALSVSEGTVRNRVNRMIESRILRIIGVADPIALGYRGYAMLGLKFAAGQNPEDIAGRFTARPEVTFVVMVAGRYDLLVEVICETQEQLKDFIFDQCYRTKDIASVEPMIGLEMYKSLMKWGQP